MTSPYLSKTRTIEELDALLEENLKEAFIAGKNITNDVVPKAIVNIDEICQSSVFSMENKSKQIIAKLDAWVDATRTEISIESDSARQEISNLVSAAKSDQHTVDVLDSMISETTRLSLDRIAKCAESSVSKIREESSQIIQELSLKAADSFNEFKALTALATKRIKESVEKAGKVFESIKNSTNGEKALARARKETQKAIGDAESASLELEKAKSRTEKRINEAMEAASKRIEQAYKASAKELQQAVDDAAAKLDMVAKDSLRGFSITHGNTE